MVKPSLYERKHYCGMECRIKFENDDLQYRKLREKINDKISQSKGGVTKDSRVCEECGKIFEVESWRGKRFCDRKCSMRHTGKHSAEPWNKGLDISDTRIESLSKKQSQTIKSRYDNGEIEIWNKGLTKDTDDRVASAVEKLTKLRNTDGEWKDKWREAMSKGQVKAWGDGKYSNFNTKPELLTKAYLENLGYLVKLYSEKADTDPENTWYQQYPFYDAFVPDFACPDLKMIIEVNGCMIHGHDLNKCQHRTAKYGWTKIAEDNQKRDRRKHSMYNRKGWRWAVVWECEAELGDFHRVQKYLCSIKE